MTSYGPRREPGVRGKADAIIRVDRRADGDSSSETPRGLQIADPSRYVSQEEPWKIFSLGVLLGCHSIRKNHKQRRTGASRGERQSLPARLETPPGAVDIDLDDSANAETGTVDWRLTFPDGAAGIAQSRVTETTRGTCIYTFVLHAPPVGLEQVEGALEAQSATLRSELATLKALMEM